MIMQGLTDEKQAEIKRWLFDYKPQLGTEQQREQLFNNSRQFGNDLRRGIPLEIRGEIWSVLIGNKHRMSYKLYNSLKIRSVVYL
jgi:hypothetical protein